MVEEVLKLTGEYLQASWNWLWPLVWNFFWFWVILFALWLVVGGFISLAVFVRCGRWVVKTYHWAVALVLMPVAFWFYIHLWVASFIWWVTNLGAQPVYDRIWAASLVVVTMEVGGLLVWRRWAFFEE